MIRIVNENGICFDTKVYDEDWNDLTEKLSISKIEFNDIGCEGQVIAKLYCMVKSLDVVATKKTIEVGQ